MAPAYIWPGSVSQEYVQLVHERRPQTLVILADYCVKLKKINACWYLRGVGENLFAAIDEELGDQWKPWIQWAMSYPSEMTQLLL